MLIYLYIKTHNKTGLKYFGKTTKQNPYKYKGSGKYWKAHIKFHGYDVTTEIVGMYTDIEECSKIAINFSIINNIVESQEWANLVIENVYGSAQLGQTCSEEVKQKFSKNAKRIWEDPIIRQQIVETHKQRYIDNPNLALQSALKGIQKQKDNGTYEQAKLARELGRIQFLNSLTIEEKNKKYEYIRSPRPQTHKDNISKALTGRVVSDEHKHNIALQRQRHKGILFDHTNEQYEIHSVFLKKYNILPYFLLDLNIPIKESQCVKLGLDYELCKDKTKAELGFRFGV